jgi:hypothetical protein
MVGKAHKSHGGDLNCMADVLMGFHRSRIQFRCRPMRFLGFSIHEKLGLCSGKAIRIVLASNLSEELPKILTVLCFSSVYQIFLETDR